MLGVLVEAPPFVLGLVEHKCRRVLGVALVKCEGRHVRVLLGRLHRPRREHEEVEVQDDVWH